MLGEKSWTDVHLGKNSIFLDRTLIDSRASTPLVDAFAYVLRLFTRDDIELSAKIWAGWEGAGRRPHAPLSHPAPIFPGMFPTLRAPSGWPPPFAPKMAGSLPLTNKCYLSTYVHPNFAFLPIRSSRFQSRSTLVLEKKAVATANIFFLGE